MSNARYRARWIFPVASPPLADGVLEIEGGVISALHNRPEPGSVDLGNVAILPGLVNAHTHLEFSDLPRPLEPRSPFPDWIRSVVSHRRSRAIPQSQIIQQGLGECLRTGTRAIGEIATDDETPQAILENPSLTEHGIELMVRAVVFRELIGLQPERHDEQVSVAKEFLQAGRNDDPRILTRGLSPHSPYSVHPDLFHELVSLCRESKAPLAMHLAETEAELELLSKGVGELVEMLKAFGIWRDGLFPKNLRILDYLEPLADVERALVVHGNYLNDEEIAFLSRHENLSVVYCPRTHNFFGHRDHPWPRLLETGVRVAIGTDSRASNPDLNLWEEIKFLRQKHPGVPPSQWIEWATRAGAIALFGPDTDLGTLQIGQPATIAIVPLAKPDATDPYRALFD